MKSLMQRDHFGADMLASVVVFLVALPLCMGIAIASGVPPALGLVTGIVGGIIVGSIAGAPLQVSGPAAGLTVLVWEVVEQYGLGALGVAVLGAGVLQAVGGALHIGRWFRAVSPAVIQGMLGGIGVLIFASQFHVMVDDQPQSSAVQNLLSIPSAVKKGVLVDDNTSHHIAALIGVTAITVLMLWNRFRPQRLSMLPGPLMAVIAATLLAQFMPASIRMVDVPDDLAQSLNVPALETFGLLLNPGFIGTVFGFALIASAETLLCATAVDRMHDGPRADYDRELLSQGVGNAICGALGALPMTGVIVRSSANVEAGAKTRRSAMLHGLWLLGLVALMPFVLQMIPRSALAAVLVYIGYRLVDFRALAELWRTRRDEAVVFAATTIAIVATDLLTGVVVGVAMALLKLVWTLSQLNVKVQEKESRVDVWLDGSATFLRLPNISEALDGLESDAEVHLHVGGLVHLDHAVLEHIKEWEGKHRRSGGTLHIDWDSAERRSRTLFPAGG